MNTLTTTVSTSTWLAAVLRALATRLDGDSIAPPTPQQLARDQLREAQVSLMNAEAESERYVHSVAMLKARTARLAGMA